MGSMGMKLGTKTWSEQSNQDLKSANQEPSSLTVEQKEKIGAEDLQAVLNRAADKNWTDNSKRVAGHGNAAMDKDAFFKLMLAQLKNQDPMNPLKNHEMAAQLAQFSTLEQMTNMNTTLSKMETKSSQPQDFQALNLIGKTVAGDSSRVVRTQFDKEHGFNFDLSQAAAEANVKLLNAKGEIVRDYKLTNLQMGNNKVTWNGQDDKGNVAPAGEYFFQVDATNTAGMKIPVKSEFKGEISGITYTAEGPVLQVGNQTIKLKDVRQITDSSAKNNDQNLKNSASLDLKNANDMQQTNNTAAMKETNTSQAPSKFQQGDVFSDVAMSKELMAQLQKEMK